METAFEEMYHRYYTDYEPYDAFLFHAREELHDISLEGKEVLEIGCGRGAFSLYMALSGKAKKVLALDESAGFGADEAYLRRLEEVVRNHSIGNVETRKASIHTAAFPEETFDVIVANFSLHHVVRSSWCLPENQKAREELLELCTSLKACLRTNGMLVLREMSRMNFWRFMPYRWKMSHIDWEIHPTLKEWLSVLNQAGFKDVSYEFLTPYFLTTWPSFLVRNRFANFFFSSTFYLYGTK
jgi:SAM-dependent methyltransferase